MNNIDLRRVLMMLVLATGLSACLSTRDQSLQLAEKQQVDAVEKTQIDPGLQQANELINTQNRYLAQRKQMPSSSQKAFAKAISLLRQEQLGAAEGVAKQLTSAHPNISAFWVLSGDIARTSGSEQESLQHYQQAVKVNPQNYYAHNRLAGVYRQQGQFTQALKHYDSALLSWPGFAQAYLNRGILHDLYLGQKAQALMDYQVYLNITDVQQQKQHHRQVNIWIADLKRQLPADASAQSVELVSHAQ